MEVQQYGTSNTAMKSKYTTEKSLISTRDCDISSFQVFNFPRPLTNVKFGSGLEMKLVTDTIQTVTKIFFFCIGSTDSEEHYYKSLYKDETDKGMSS